MFLVPYAMAFVLFAMANFVLVATAGLALHLVREFNLVRTIKSPPVVPNLPYGAGGTVVVHGGAGGFGG